VPATTHPKLDRRNGESRVYYLVDRSAHHKPALLKPSDVAVKLAVSRTWLYDAAKAGRIPSIRVGGEGGPLRFVAEDLERWLAEARSSWVPGEGPVATRRAPAPDPGLRIVS
jgi:excisionase family DNA binding protein